MTPAEAQAQLEALRFEVPGILDRQLRETASQAAAELRRIWPRDTGESGDAWDDDDDAPAVVNDAPHTPYVHDGLAFRLVPEVLEALEADTVDRIDQEIRHVAGWED